MSWLSHVTWCHAEVKVLWLLANLCPFFFTIYFMFLSKLLVNCPTLLTLLLGCFASSSAAILLDASWTWARIFRLAEVCFNSLLVETNVKRYYILILTGCEEAYICDLLMRYLHNTAVIMAGDILFSWTHETFLKVSRLWHRQHNENSMLGCFELARLQKKNQPQPKKTITRGRFDFFSHHKVVHPTRQLVRFSWYTFFILFSELTWSSALLTNTNPLLMSVFFITFCCSHRNNLYRI